MAASAPTQSPFIAYHLTTHTSPAILSLTAALETELNNIYTPTERSKSQSNPTHTPPPALTYLLASSPTGTPLGCIAFFIPPAQFFADDHPSTALPPKTAELTRMYIAPTSRRSGLSQTLLWRMEKVVREEFDVDVLVLRTGIRQGPAIRLYERAGYVRRALYGDYVKGGPEDGNGGVSVVLGKDLRGGLMGSEGGERGGR